MRNGSMHGKVRSQKILIANRGEIALADHAHRAPARLWRRRGLFRRRSRRAACARGRSGGADRRGAAGAILSEYRGDHRGGESRAAPTRCIPATAFSPRTRTSRSACRDAGLVFIGPSPEAIKAMGNKAGAKEIMQKAGVPCVPGYQGADQSDAVMLAEANKIGFPVMIKAVAGGGGRGMRLVADAAAFPDALRSARSEAKGAFGDATVILERAIVDPRHIEIQVFGDAHGNAIHLGERDCSVQRRHQKLIEEAPSPAVSPELRARMGAIAVAAVKAIALRRRRHAGIPARCERRLLFHGNEHAAAGRASRHRGDHRARSGRTAIARRGRRAARRSRRRTSDSPATRSRCGCARRTPRTISCRNPAGWRCGRCRTALRVEHALQSGCGDSAVLRFDDRQARQPWRDPRRGAAAS